MRVWVGGWVELRPKKVSLTHTLTHVPVCCVDAPKPVPAPNPPPGVVPGVACPNVPPPPAPKPVVVERPKPVCRSDRRIRDGLRAHERHKQREMSDASLGAATQDYSASW